MRAPFTRWRACLGTVVSQNIKAINDALQIMQLEIRSCSKGGKLYHALVNQARARGEGAPPRIGSRERARAHARAAGERSGREGSQHPLAVVVRDRASLGSASRALLTRTPRRARVPAGRLICLTTPSK